MSGIDVLQPSRSDDDDLTIMTFHYKKNEMPLATDISSMERTGFFDVRHFRAGAGRPVILQGMR
ncbi:hypothetical protein LQ564_08560 [Massilia sp. G4R7]|uniref:Uncharacterized protein n=1 Tax=Massilia phyllostachyos TaxID=2898585 RepID=A0ABS8Q3P1_9BURK|nr:hypothetical protein [Massilia phyllostachyos]MCD2516364.1 hypothetical protein [Massilia phyllostachyos]